MKTKFKLIDKRSIYNGKFINFVAKLIKFIIDFVWCVIKKYSELNTPIGTSKTSNINKKKLNHYISTNMEHIIINNSSDLYKFTNDSFDELSVDIEGDNLCRDGKIFTIQVFAPKSNKFFLFDCKKLSMDDVRSSLNSVFASNSIKKYFFDCRSDIDALYHQYNIQLNNVIDVQLYEVGFRKCNGISRTRFYCGLKKTLETYSHEVGVTKYELEIKDKISNQFRSNIYDINLDDQNVLKYLEIDVVYLPKLYNLFFNKIGRGRVFQSIQTETEQRIKIWMKPVFINSKSNAISAI